jgi:hypothetical protein
MDADMKLLFVILILIPATGFFSCGTAPPQSVASAPTPKGAWHVYTSPDKTFSIELPCEPKQTNVSANSTPVFEYSCHWEDSDDLQVFLMSVSKADFEVGKTFDEAAFERSVKDTFTPNHHIEKMIPIKIDGGIGREVFVTNTRDDMDNIRGRVIIFGAHRFEVAYLATDLKRLESPEAERFFASFKPLK